MLQGATLKSERKYHGFVSAKVVYRLKYKDHSVLVQYSAIRALVSKGSLVAIPWSGGLAEYKVDWKKYPAAWIELYYMKDGPPDNVQNVVVNDRIWKILEDDLNLVKMSDHIGFVRIPLLSGGESVCTVLRDTFIPNTDLRVFVIDDLWSWPQAKIDFKKDL